MENDAANNIPGNADPNPNPTIGAFAMPLPKPFPDTSKIEVFDGKNFKRWQERVYSVLDMHGVALCS
ncbi:hypothetical protein K1719_039711 [Acacia pycnantha]|nr:hypothetical protein K1719_039711 [Acacia pycnantha]